MVVWNMPKLLMFHRELRLWVLKGVEPLPLCCALGSEMWIQDVSWMIAWTCCPVNNVTLLIYEMQVFEPEPREWNAFIFSDLNDGSLKERSVSFLAEGIKWKQGLFSVAKELENISIMKSTMNTPPCFMFSLNTSINICEKILRLTESRAQKIHR